MTGLVVDRFAGPGGWDEGVRPLGLAPLGIEWNEAACATARAAGHERLAADVAALDPREFGRVWGGIDSPPCPGWSAGGKGGARGDSGRVLAALAGVRTRRDLERVLVELRPVMDHPETLLALEPLRWALTLTPSWLAWEQVKEVQPLWNACAAVLRRIGYTVATGVLNAEQYGVPQTRRRAILVARAPWFTREHGPARLPEPTHSRYHLTSPTRLDLGVKPWVSMSEALGWHPDDLVGFPRRADTPSNRAGSGVVTLGGTEYRSRDLFRAGARPANTLTEKARSWKRWPADGSPAVRVTVEEASRLQTFRSDYPWQGTRTSTFHQIGNAVPPLLARAIVAEVAAIDDPAR